MDLKCMVLLYKMGQPFRQLSLNRNLNRNRAPLGEKREGVVDKVKKSIRKGVDKFNAFKQSDQGQQLGTMAKDTIKKAAVTFLADSGLGQKAVNSVNESAKKFTQGTPLDVARHGLHWLGTNYFRNHQSLPEPDYSYNDPTEQVTRQTYSVPSPRMGSRYLQKRR